MARDLYRLVPSVNLSNSLVLMEHFSGQQLQDAVNYSQKFAAFKSLKEDGVETPFSKYCFNHPRMKLDLFCKRCEVDVCKECITTKHRKHKYITSSDKIDEETRRLGEATNSIEEMMEEMKRAISGVKEMKQRVRNRKDDNINVTRELFATLHKAIDEREEQAIADIKEEAYKRERALELQQEMLVLLWTQLKNCLELMKNTDEGKIRAEDFTRRRMILEQRCDYLKKMKKKSRLQAVTIEQAESECENIEQLLKVLNKLPFVPLDPSKCGYYKISIIADGHHIQGSSYEPSETLKLEIQTKDKDVQTDKDVQEKGVQTECREIAVIPPQGRDLKDQVEKLRKENSDLISRLTELEEQSFKFTNAFTTADEGRIIKLRETYRNLQDNGRPAANRAHKKAYRKIPSPILNHTMLAYEEAKNLALQEFKVVSDRLLSLFELKTPADNSTQVKPDELKTPGDNPSQGKRDKAMMQSQQLLESFHAKPMNEKIYQMLIDKYKALTNQAPDDKIPQAIDDYYSSLAKFTWDCVARPIPMILNTDAQKFDDDIHETKDGDDDVYGDSIKGKYISYIYPVLFTSNSWPREIAMKGKVNVLDSYESII